MLFGSVFTVNSQETTPGPRVPLAVWLLLALALFAVSSAGAVLQELDAIPPLLRASWRLQATCVVLLPLFVFQIFRPSSYFVSKRDVLILLGSSVCLALHFAAWIWSLDNTSLVHSLLFVTSHPIAVVAFMPLMGSRVGRGHIVGAIVGVLGAALALGDAGGGGGEVTALGDLAAFFGAVFVVGYMFAGSHLRSVRQMPIFIYALPVTLLACLWLSLGAVFIEGAEVAGLVPNMDLFGWSDALWLPWIAYLAVGPGLVGHTGINACLRWIPPIVISIALIFEPLIGGVIGWVMTGESSLGLWTLIGGPLMITGAVLVTLEQRRPQDQGEV
jgi:drug/metabolite transporter (DMT)-like permease